MLTLLLTDDLMLSSQVAAVANQQGWTVHCCATPAALLERCRDAEVRQVVVDLNVAQVQPEAIIAAVRKACPASVTVSAVAPHVHKAKIDAARQAGYDGVFSRGQFHSNMAELLGPGD